MTIETGLQDQRQPPEARAAARARAADAIAPGGTATNSTYRTATAEGQINTLDWLAGLTDRDPLGGDLPPTTDGLQALVTAAADAEDATRGGVREGAVWQTAAWLRLTPGVDAPI